MTDGSVRLHQLTTTELGELMNTSDESSFMTYLQLEPSLVQLKGERERLERENLRVAKETLDLEPTFSSGRQQLIDTCQKYTHSKEKFEKELESLRSILSGVSPEDVLQQLRKDSEKKEDHSEEVTDRFLGGGLTIQEFLKQFQQDRIEAHIYRVKSEQMSKCVRRDQPVRPRTAGFNPTPPSFPPAYLPSQPPAPQPGARFPVPQPGARFPAPQW